MNLRIATPIAGITPVFMTSMMQLQAELIKNGSSYGVVWEKWHHIFNESLVPRARNKLAARFLEDKQLTHLLFWDADLGVDIRDLLLMLHQADNNPDYKVMGAIYPKKKISWDKIVKAVVRNFENIPNSELAKVLGIAGAEFVYNLKDKPTGEEVEMRSDTPVEVYELGTGLMLISRDVLEQMVKCYPEIEYSPLDGDTPWGLEGNREKPMYDFFNCGVHSEDNRRIYDSEDYGFCRLWRKLGGRLWMCPWIKTEHQGLYTFTGDLFKMGELLGRVE